jgi:hypothetical protein
MVEFLVMTARSYEMVTNVAEKNTVSILTEEITLTLNMKTAPRKQWSAPTRQNGVVSQTSVISSFTFIKTSNLVYKQDFGMQSTYVKSYS